MLPATKDKGSNSMRVSVGEWSPLMCAAFVTLSYKKDEDFIDKLMQKG